MTWTGQEEPRTYADMAARREQLVQLCDRLGLDASETTEVHVDIESKAVVVRWEGVRRLTGHDAAQLVAGIVAGFPVDLPDMCGLHDRPRPCQECE